MARSHILIALVALFATSAIAAPIFIRTSNSIDKSSHDMFMNGDQFASTFEENFLAKKGAPKNLFVFNVQIKDRKFIENPRLLLKEVAKRRNLKNHFQKPEHSLSSSYIETGLTQEFHDKIMKSATKNHYHVLHSNLKNFDFKGTSHALNSKGKVIDVIDVNLDQLDTLNSALNNHGNEFNKISKGNNLMLLKFIDATKENSSILNLVERNEKELEEPRILAETKDKPKSHFPISADGFFGYIVSVILMIAVYIGSIVLNDIKTPKTFYDKALQIGKEH